MDHRSGYSLVVIPEGLLRKKFKGGPCDPLQTFDNSRSDGSAHAAQRSRVLAQSARSFQAFL